MSAEVVLLLRLFGLSAVVLAIDIYLSVRAARSVCISQSKYRDYKPALERTYSVPKSGRRQ